MHLKYAKVLPIRFVHWLRCHCKPDQNNFHLYVIQHVVVIVPNLCYWRRSSVVLKRGRYWPWKTPSSHLIFWISKICFTMYSCTGFFNFWLGPAVADPGPAPSYFLDQTEARRAEKKFLETGPLPPYLRVLSHQSDFGMVIGKFVPPLCKKSKMSRLCGAISSLTFTVSP